MQTCSKHSIHAMYANRWQYILKLVEFGSVNGSNSTRWIGQLVEMARIFFTAE